MNSTPPDVTETRNAPEPSTEAPVAELKKTERIRRTGGHPMANGAVGEKADDFWSSARRLLRRLRPERLRIGVVVLLTVFSVAVSAVGPRLLGHATDLVLNGLLGQRATSTGEVPDVAPDVAANMDVVPGQGVDFDAVGRVLLLVRTQRRRAGRRAPAPGRRRGQDPPDAARLLRPAAAR
jgi:ATP-binding cassette, subfamily B, multidrug efflux pump